MLEVGVEQLQFRFLAQPARCSHFARPHRDQRGRCRPATCSCAAAIPAGADRRESPARVRPRLPPCRSRRDSAPAAARSRPALSGWTNSVGQDSAGSRADHLASPARARQSSCSSRATCAPDASPRSMDSSVAASFVLRAIRPAAGFMALDRPLEVCVFGVIGVSYPAQDRGERDRGRGRNFAGGT